MINVDIWLKDHEAFLNRRKNCTLSQFPRLLITNFSRLIMIKKSFYGGLTFWLKSESAAWFRI